MAVKEGWLLKRGPAVDSAWSPQWCVLDQNGFKCFADSDQQVVTCELALGPGSRACRFANIRAPGDSPKHRKEKPSGFVVEVNVALPKQRRDMGYFDAEEGEIVTEWLAAIEGWVKASTWHPGDFVCVREAFCSDSEVQVPLKPGQYGLVVEVDGDGDTKVDFPGMEYRQWVLEKNQHKIRLEKDLEPKEVFLEIVPQNDVIMHWALRIGTSRISRCYEFEADGVCMSWETLLHKGYDITKQRLGVVRKPHREITAWCKRFGAENSYNATGNGLLGGKNCQDFVVELCEFLGIDTEQLPYRQAEKVKTVLGAGALVAADAALGMGLVAGAVDMGAAVGTAAMAAMGTAVSAPALMAAAVTLAGAGTVVAGAGMLASEFGMNDSEPKKVEF